MEKVVGSHLPPETKVFGNKFSKDKSTVFFATNAVGGGKAVARVIEVLDRENRANWISYSQGKSLAAMEIYNFPEVESYGVCESVRRFNPKVVITSVSQTIGVDRTLTHFSSRRGIPVIWVVDFQGGVTSKHFDKLYRYEIGPEIFCVQDNDVRDVLLDTKIPGIKENPERIRVTGQPAFDNITLIKDRRVEVTSKVKKSLGLAKDEKTLLFAGQLEGTEETLEDLVSELNNQERDITLVVRFHPRDESKSKYSSILRNYNNKWIEADGSKIQDTNQLVVAVDGVVSMFSTLNMDAIALGVPTAYLLEQDIARQALLKDGQMHHNNLPMVKHGAADLIERKDQISLFIKNIFDNPGYVTRMRQFQQEHYLFDGQAGNRIVNIIESILNKD